VLTFAIVDMMVAPSAKTVVQWTMGSAPMLYLCMQYCA